MNNITIPVSDEFIEDIAKAIARDRLYRRADLEIQEISGGLRIQDIEFLDRYFEELFKMVWNGNHQEDEMQRREYRADAKAAIDAINLKLLLSE